MQSIRKALHLGMEYPVAPVVIQTQKALAELESSQQPLKEALSQYYPFTGPYHRSQPKASKRRVKGVS